MRLVRGVLFPAGVIACSRGSVSPAVIVRDSAAIRIVDNVVVAAPGSIVIESMPVFDIGGGSSGDNYEYIGPISAAVQLSGGTIVAAGWAQTELRVFDSTGRWLRTIGRQGSGPGEFEGLGWVFRGPADSMITFELANRRIQVFDPEGTSVRLTSPPQLAWLGFPGIEGVFADGSIVFRGTLPEPAASTDRVLRSRVTLIRYRPDSSRVDSLASYLGIPDLRHPKNPQWTYGSALFAPAHSVAAFDRQIALTSGDRFSIALSGMDGRPTRIIRRRWVPVPVLPGEIRAAVAKWVADVEPEIREAVRTGLIAISDAKVKPAIASLRFATDGRLWVGYGDRNDDDPAVLAVFDTAGRWQSDVAMPRGVTVLEFGSDYLLASARDDDGFHHLRRYRILRLDPKPQ